ncbi:MAG: geranylgeranylglyceryl/heptaprenylglyceryl phosphate synthase [Candidatus Hydrothermarchaeota archaeon]|nr:geranylgeranylglyceryl/heptaprenylglyceryl phosphate synthase [Candidatus Hydrothermarchaeota archaeon]
MKVLEYLKGKSLKRPVHLTLLDPNKQQSKVARSKAMEALEGGTDGIMIGGSAGINQDNLDETARCIKGITELPVILFPGDVTGITRYADALFFMSLLNSRNPYYITGAQAIGASFVKKAGIESIPMGYIVIEPGGAVGCIGDAKLIPRDCAEIAVSYALAAQNLGMKIVYLEAGSGVAEHVPPRMITGVKAALDIPLIVGGGIRTPEDALTVVKAGADIIVTGTLVEKVENVREGISSITSVIKSR